MNYRWALFTTAVLLTAGTSAMGQESKPYFEDPVALKVGDQPINKDRKMMYPSPAMFDVDQDGQDELVVGTLSGQVFALENSNSGKGDPKWAKPVKVKSSDDEPLSLDNW